LNPPLFVLGVLAVRVKRKKFLDLSLGGVPSSLLGFLQSLTPKLAAVWTEVVQEVEEEYASGENVTDYAGSRGVVARKSTQNRQAKPLGDTKCLGLRSGFEGSVLRVGDPR
jgi:hypothetical protein